MTTTIAIPLHVLVKLRDEEGVINPQSVANTLGVKTVDLLGRAKRNKQLKDGQMVLSYRGFKGLSVFLKKSDFTSKDNIVRLFPIQRHIPDHFVDCYTSNSIPLIDEDAEFILSTSVFECALFIPTSNSYIKQVMYIPHTEVNISITVE